MDSQTGVDELDDLEAQVEGLRDALYKRDEQRAAALAEYRIENKAQYDRIVVLENALKAAESGTAMESLRATIKTQQRAIDERQKWIEKAKVLIQESNGFK